MPTNIHHLPHPERLRLIDPDTNDRVPLFEEERYGGAIDEAPERHRGEIRFRAVVAGLLLASGAISVAALAGLLSLIVGMPR